MYLIYFYEEIHLKTNEMLLYFLEVEVEVEDEAV